MNLLTWRVRIQAGRAWQGWSHGGAVHILPPLVSSSKPTACSPDPSIPSSKSSVPLISPCTVSESSLCGVKRLDASSTQNNDMVRKPRDRRSMVALMNLSIAGSMGSPLCKAVVTCFENMPTLTRRWPKNWVVKKTLETNWWPTSLTGPFSTCTLTDIRPVARHHPESSEHAAKNFSFMARQEQINSYDTVQNDTLDTRFSFEVT